MRLGILIDADTKNILAFVITDERVGESHQLPSLLDEGLDRLGVIRDPNNRTPQIIMLLGDKGYDSRANFSRCKELGIHALIPVRVNTNCRADGVDRARTEAVIDQLGDGHSSREILRMLKDERLENQKKWKKRKDFGSRWLVEIVFSSFKRTLGESVMAKKWSYIIREITNKVNVYNWLLDVSEEAMKLA